MFAEALAEAWDTKQPCMQHVSKAFDVVWHNSMLRKLYNLGLPSACWNILKDSYAEMSSVVNWGGESWIAN